MTGLVDDIEPTILRVVSSRNLHSDKHMAQVREDIPGFLKKYFNFPNDEYPERLQVYSPILKRKIYTVEHVVEALKLMFVGGKLVYQWATDHCKSDTGTFFFPITSLAEDPDEAHIILAANFQDSKRRLQKVQRELETNKQLLEDFPWLKKPERTRYSSGGLTWSRTELTVSGRSSNRANPSLYAAALGSDDVRGRRGKLIGDDVEGEEHRRLASKRQQLYDFIKLEAIRCWEDRTESSRPLLCFMGTPYDMDSVYRKLEDEDWHVIKVPAYRWEYDRFSGCLKKPDGTSTKAEEPWQERAALMPDKAFTWPRKRFKVTAQDPKFGRGMTRTQFAISYLLDPSAGDPTRLDFKTLQRLVEKAEFAGEDQNWITAVSLDPAAGTGNDYAGVSVVRIRWPQGEKFPDVQVLESYALTQGLFEQVGFCADLCQRYEDARHQPARLVYESNAQQGGVYRNAFGHLRPEIPLVPIYTSAGAKFDQEMGLTVIRDLVRLQHLKVPASQLDSEGAQTLLHEIRDLGSAAHDHIACSVWFVVRWVYDQVRAYSGPPLVASGGAAQWGWGVGSVGSGGQVPSWRTWRR